MSDDINPTVESTPNQSAAGDMNQRILVVDDDARLRTLLQRFLEDDGYIVRTAHDGSQMDKLMQRELFSLIVLDLMLPNEDGISICHRLRAENSDIPIIMLTAKGSDADRIAGLEAGADDYLPKPFDMGELLARMRAVVRRKGGLGSPVLENGVLALDPAAYTATRVGHAAVQLSKREFALLHALMQRPGAILSRAQLEDRVYGWGEEVESNAIEYLIHALRKKLGSDAIKNVRGAGWMVPKGQ